MAVLTDRQKQIKRLLDQNKSAEQVAKSLKISTNAVYQQIRRMRAAGHSVSTPSGAGGSAGRQSARKGKSAKKGRTRPRLESSPPAPRIPPTPAPAPAAKVPTTPLQSVRARRDEIQALVKEAEAGVTIAQRDLDNAKALAEKIAQRHADELKGLDKAEAALRPQQAPAKPAAKKATPKRQSAPKPAAPAPAPAPAPADDAQASSNGSQAAQEPPSAPEGASETTEAPAAA